jgi:hypothetical protein
MNRDNLSDGLNMVRTTKSKSSTEAQIVRRKIPPSVIVGIRPRTWESMIGCVKYAGPRKSIREMDLAISAKARLPKRPRHPLMRQRDPSLRSE